MRLLCVVIAFAWSWQGVAAAPEVAGNESWRNAARNVAERAARVLSPTQHADGSWSTPDQPAVTALALVALDPKARGNNPQFATNFSRGYEFLEKNVKEDGGIYKEGLANYNTSIGLIAFVAR